jgi:DNA repair protein RadD
LVHAAYRVCPECGTAFPEPETKSKLSDQADGSAILSGEITDVEYPVRETFYSLHTKKGADSSVPKTMRVEYEIGYNHYVSEWVCPEHIGFAKKKFETWWKQRSNCPVPETTQDTVTLACQGVLAKTNTVMVRSISGEKYDRVIGYDIGNKPDYIPEPGWNDVETVPPELDYEFADEDIPF